MVFMAIGQKKQITVEGVFANEFRTEGLDALRSMKNGKQYTVLNRDYKTGRTTIDKYDYTTQKKVETIVDSQNLDALKEFSAYEFNEDESKFAKDYDEKGSHEMSRSYAEPQS